MARLPQDVTGKMVRHIFDLRRVENGLFFDVSTPLNLAEIETTKALIQNDLGGAIRFDAKQRRLNKVMLDADKVIADTIHTMDIAMRKSIRDLAIMESEFAGTVLQTVTGTDASLKVAFGRGILDANLLRRLIEEEPYDGIKLEDWWKRQRVATRAEFRKRMQLGMTNGESTAELVRRIRGNKSAGFRDGLFARQGLSGHQVKAIVRTAVNQISNRAAEETYRANSDITTEYEYVATLDDRTTPICRSLDGQVFAYTDPGGFRPPQHPGCRSVISPKVDHKKLGLKPPPEGTRSAGGENPGPVKSSVKYADWLRMQSIESQNKILGPARAKLFRQGKITLASMLRSDGRLLTLGNLNNRIAVTKRKITSAIPKPSKPKLVIPTVPRVQDVPSTLNVKEFRDFMEKVGVDRKRMTGINTLGEAFLPDIARSVTKLLSTHPELADSFHIKGNKASGALATAWYRIKGGKVERILSVSNKHHGKKSLVRFKDGKAVEVSRRQVAEESARYGFDTGFSSTKTVEGVMDHEMGHFIDYLGKYHPSFGRQPAERWRDQLIALERKTVSEQVAQIPIKARLFIESTRPKDDFFWRKNAKIRLNELKRNPKSSRPDEISRYGQSSVIEGFAEYYGKVVETKFLRDPAGKITNLTARENIFLEKLIEGYRDAKVPVPSYLLE